MEISLPGPGFPSGLGGPAGVTLLAWRPLEYRSHGLNAGTVKHVLDGTGSRPTNSASLHRLLAEVASIRGRNRLYNICQMIELSIPGRGSMRLQHLVTDVNGTLAVDGILIEGLAKRIASIQDRLSVHMLTADTHGRQAAIDRQLNLTATRLSTGSEQEQKRSYVEKLGSDSVVAIGQGANDAAMLKAAALGICVMSEEGTAVETLLAADIVVRDILAAFDLLDKPLRLVATLRK